MEEEREVKLFYLSTGEKIISEVISTEDTFINLNFPLKIEKILDILLLEEEIPPEDSDEESEVTIVPWLEYSKTYSTVILPIYNIVSISIPIEELENAYLERLNECEC